MKDPMCPGCYEYTMPEEWTADKARLAEAERALHETARVLAQCQDERDGNRERLADAERLLETVAPIAYAQWKASLAGGVKADTESRWTAVSASVVQYKPCEICTTQSWCETHGCQCYPVSAVQPERCCLDYPRCDCNSPPEPDNLPCGHPWKAQHDFKCILCSSPGTAQEKANE